VPTPVLITDVLTDEARRTPHRMIEPHLLVLSPHLDDAVLSCGGLLSSLQPGVGATILTFFTHAGRAPVTRAARSFVRQVGWSGDPESFYAARRREDREAADRIGATCEHAGLVDALFRPRDSGVLAGRIGSLLTPGLRRVLPELTYRYPSYRYDIARGRVSRGDRKLLKELTSRIAERLDDLEPALVLSPLGIGRHVDHLLVREATVAASAGRTGVVPAFYTDLPYALRHRPDPGTVHRHRLRPVTFPAGRPGKKALIALYRTQVDALYPEGAPDTPDEYWWPPEPDPDVVLSQLSTVAAP
jgi:LmbE family N-acetylglucosaminyl deacetylase